MTATGSRCCLPFIICKCGQSPARYSSPTPLCPRSRAPVACGGQPVSRPAAARGVGPRRLGRGARNRADLPAAPLPGQGPHHRGPRQCVRTEWAGSPGRGPRRRRYITVYAGGATGGRGNARRRCEDGLPRMHNTDPRRASSTRGAGPSRRQGGKGVESLRSRALGVSRRRRLRRPPPWLLRISGGGPLAAAPGTASRHRRQQCRLRSVRRSFCAGRATGHCRHPSQHEAVHAGRSSIPQHIQPIG